MNTYSAVTERILSLLNSGHIPWNQPWIGSGTCAFNRVTGHVYSVLNQILVGEPGEFASYVQWRRIGGKIRKGSAGHKIVFWTHLLVKGNKTEDSEGKEEKRKTIPYLKEYTVFNISQVEGVQALNEEQYPDVFRPDSSADDVINKYVSREKIDIIEEEYGNKSFYSFSHDSVTIPGRKQFKSSEAYYDTLFHELIHSTGASKRLGRTISNIAAPFGSKEYGREELVAEIGAAMLMHRLGLATDDTLINNAAYIQDWSQTLEKDEKCFVYAASRAEKAVNFMLDEKENEMEEKGNE